MAKKLPSILIGVPCHEMVSASFAQSLASMVEYMASSGYRITVNFYEGTLVHTARKQLVMMALTKNVDYLFFMDSDMVIHPHTVALLLQNKKDIVSPMFFKRVSPYQPCFYSEVKFENDKPVLYTPVGWEKLGLHECHATGLAATLISRKVLKALNPETMFLGHPDLGEDISFCLHAREAGFKVYVDTRLVAGHIGKVIVTDKTYMEVNQNGKS